MYTYNVKVKPDFNLWMCTVNTWMLKNRPVTAGPVGWNKTGKADWSSCCWA